MVSQALIQAVAGRNAPPAVQPANRMTTLPTPRTDMQGAIDPATGKPYAFSTNGSGGEGVWIPQGTNMSGANAMGLGGYSGTDGGGANLNDITPYALNQTDWLKSIGAPGVGSDLYNGNQTPNGSGENFAGLDSTGNLENYLKQQGITLAEKSGESTGQNRVFQAFKNGQPVGQTFKVKDNEDAFQIAVLALGAGAGALAAGGAGVGAGVGAEGGTGVSAVLPGEIGGATEAGYGGGGLLADGGADIAAEAPGMSGGGEVLNANAAGLTQPIDVAASGVGGTGTTGGLGLTGSGAGGFGGTGLTGSQLLAGAGGASGLAGVASGGLGSASDIGNYSGYTGGGSSLGSTLSNLLQNPNGGLSGLGQGLVGLGTGALTGALGGGDTSQLNAVNYQQAATAQGQSARTNQTNAQGSLSYNQNGVDAQGNPTYSQDVKLNAPYQANLNSALGDQSTALGNLNAYNKGLPGAYAGVSGVFGDAGSQQGLVKQAQDAAYNSQTQYLDPQYQMQQKALTTQLANQGVNYGSDAYNNAMTQFGSQQNQAYGGARDSAINIGNQYANTLFNQNLQAHQTGMADINNQGTNYLNQSSGALNGVTQNPTFATPPPATNYLGAAQLQGNANLNQYNAKVGNLNNVTNGLTGIAGSLLANPSVTNGLGNLFSGAGSAIGGLFGGGG